MEDLSHIIFYDGDCGFCNKSVQFVLKHEKKQIIQFSALQSNFAIDFFEKIGAKKPDLSTFYFYSNGQMYERSSAALKVIPELKWYLQFLRIGWLLPRFVRDSMYDFIAKRRTKLANGFCLIPSTENRQRFLS